MQVKHRDCFQGHQCLVGTGGSQSPGLQRRQGMGAGVGKSSLERVGQGPGLAGFAGQETEREDAGRVPQHLPHQVTSVPITQGRLHCVQAPLGWWEAAFGAPQKMLWRWHLEGGYDKVT